MAQEPPNLDELSPPVGPFRRAVIRGLGVLLPPLLTIVIFVWVANTVKGYLLESLEGVARSALMSTTADIRAPEDFQNVTPNWR